MAGWFRQRFPAVLLGAIRARRNGLDAVPPEALTHRWVEQRFLAWRFVLANDPAAIRSILTREEDEVGKAPWVRRTVGPALGDGLLSTEGPAWRSSRVVVQPMFHAGRIAARHLAICRAAEEMGARWAEGGERDVVPDLSRATREILLDLFFDPDFAGILETLGDLIPIFQETAGRARFKTLLPVPEWWPAGLGGRFRRARRALDRALDEAIARRRADPEPHDDLPGRLLAAAGEAGLDEARIRAEIATLFFAGYETTANGMAWAIWEMARRPDLVEDMRAELMRVTNGALPSAEQLQDLSLINRFVAEVLRLHPPGWMIGRYARRPLTVPSEGGGSDVIPARATINIASWVTHRSPLYWRDPERFDPDRFRPEASEQRPKGAYYPFGHGPRACPGRGLALAEMTVLTALVARDFTLQPAGPDPKPLGRVTLRPGSPVLVLLAPRRQPRAT